MELPTSKLAEWTELADLDFILAHTVLAEKDYAQHFANRPAGRELILDNSYHELGYALSSKDLVEAAQRCRADYIISPDNVNDVDFTIESYKHLRANVKGYKIAVVWTGFQDRASWQEREAFLSHVTDADMLCCTFKLKDRLQYFIDSERASHFSRVHLLGVDSLKELQEWTFLAKHLFHIEGRTIKWSVDTGKALKWAMKGRKLDELKSLRSSEDTTSKGEPSVASQQLLTLKAEEITPQQEMLFRYNVGVLRRVL
jgi:hypothetical protein